MLQQVRGYPIHTQNRGSEGGGGESDHPSHPDFGDAQICMPIIFSLRTVRKQLKIRQAPARKYFFIRPRCPSVLWGKHMAHRSVRSFRMCVCVCKFVRACVCVCPCAIFDNAIFNLFTKRPFATAVFFLSRNRCKSGVCVANHVLKWCVFMFSVFASFDPDLIISGRTNSDSIYPHKKYLPHKKVSRNHTPAAHPRFRPRRSPYLPADVPRPRAPRPQACYPPPKIVLNFGLFPFTFPPTYVYPIFRVFSEPLIFLNLCFFCLIVQILAPDFVIVNHKIPFYSPRKSFGTP